MWPLKSLDGISYRSGMAVARAFFFTGREHSGRNDPATLLEHTMNWDRVEGNWKQVSGKIKQQWGKLTDDALTQVNGKRDQLVGKIQDAYGVTRDDADRQVKDWESRNQ